MWYPAKIAAGSVTEPVTVADAKAQCRVTTSSEDAYFDRLIKAARAHVEKVCNLRFAEQALTIDCTSFADFARIPESPIQSAGAVITYVDAAGEAATLADTVYTVHDDGFEPSICLKPGQNWPGIQQGSRITLAATFGGSAPDEVQHAMLLLIGAWYENREETAIGVTVASLPRSANVDALLVNSRRGAL